MDSGKLDTRPRGRRTLPVSAAPSRTFTPSSGFFDSEEADSKSSGPGSRSDRAEAVASRRDDGLPRRDLQRVARPAKRARRSSSDCFDDDFLGLGSSVGIQGILKDRPRKVEVSSAPESATLATPAPTVALVSSPTPRVEAGETLTPSSTSVATEATAVAQEAVPEETSAAPLGRGGQLTESIPEAPCESASPAPILAPSCIVEASQTSTVKTKAKAKATLDPPESACVAVSLSESAATLKAAKASPPSRSSGEPRTVKVKPKAKAKPKLKPTQEPDVQDGSKLPFGVNLVRQDLKRLKKKGASAGGTKAAKMMRKHYNANGTMKAKYTRSLGPGFDGTKVDTGNSKYARRRYQEACRISTTSMVDVVGRRVETFSPAVTATLLDALPAPAPGDALGAIAERRPPDVEEHIDVLPTEPKLSQFDVTTESGGCDTLQQELSGADTCVLSSVEAYDAADTVGAPSLPAKAPQDLSAEDVRSVLRTSFGHEEFRPGQEEAVLSVLAGKSTLLLLATGSGKSLCYQLPAFLLREEGLTLVISPLISLMADQLLRLPGCLRGAVISGQQTREQVKKVMRAVRGRLIDVLFISPERLSMWAFDGCSMPPIALACIDEAHCVSEWSHNFRPDYLRIREFLTESMQAQRLMALTATATRPTVKSICNILDVEVIVRADKSFALSELLEEPSQPRVQRTNLSMDVLHVGDEEAQVREVAKLLSMPEYAKTSAIVYVWKRATVDSLTKYLAMRVRGGVRGYHGSMLPEARRSVQDAFMAGLVRVVVATMAFGMGLDKPDIRTIIHFNLPKSIENYIQETGRGSRDGKPGRCVALLNPKDYKVMRWMESGGGGAGERVGLVRRLLAMLFMEGTKGSYKRFPLSVDAMESFGVSSAAETSVGGSTAAYSVAFEAREMSRGLNCSPDELHSVLAHLAYRTRGRLVLFSNFPTKMKLRFFGQTSVEDLQKQDPLLRRVLPLAKKTMGVYSIETANAISNLGGKPGELSNALWQAQGDEFSIEKSDWGHMLVVLQPVDDAQVTAWAAEITGINASARANGVEKLDAMFLAFNRAADANGSASDTPTPEPVDTSPSVDKVLTDLIDTYFAAGIGDGKSSVAVAGSVDTREKMMRQALGSDYNGSLISRQSSVAGASEPSKAASDSGSSEATSTNAAVAGAVHHAVARLAMGGSWPKLGAGDLASESRAMAQVLAGIGSVLLPAKKWKDHPCWGKFRNLAEFNILEEFVMLSLEKVRRVQSEAAARAAAKM
eukprot:TRINITY_DN4188_c3_g1_i1.p1 TRINITY_DN4188_c3_g1~~TRINITY_DN4188_c3_g1_i1.p1  ORF type:complete len:1254 (+),score=187.56 TRINITY_DN4188_c3_g1_i1:87-3848(+)